MCVWVCELGHRTTAITGFVHLKERKMLYGMLCPLNVCVCAVQRTLHYFIVSTFHTNLYLDLFILFLFIVDLTTLCTLLLRSVFLYWYSWYVSCLKSNMKYLLMREDIMTSCVLCCTCFIFIHLILKRIREKKRISSSALYSLVLLRMLEILEANEQMSCTIHFMIAFQSRTNLDNQSGIRSRIWFFLSFLEIGNAF